MKNLKYEIDLIKIIGFLYKFKFQSISILFAPILIFMLYLYTSGNQLFDEKKIKIEFSEISIFYSNNYNELNFLLTNSSINNISIQRKYIEESGPIYGPSTFFILTQEILTSKQNLDQLFTKFFENIKKNNKTIKENELKKFYNLLTESKISLSSEQKKKIEIEIDIKIPDKSDIIYFLIENFVNTFSNEVFNKISKEVLYDIKLKSNLLNQQIILINEFINAEDKLLNSNNSNILATYENIKNKLIIDDKLISLGAIERKIIDLQANINNFKSVEVNIIEKRGDIKHLKSIIVILFVSIISFLIFFFIKYNNYYNRNINRKKILNN